MHCTNLAFQATLPLLGPSAFFADAHDGTSTDAIATEENEQLTQAEQAGDRIAGIFHSPVCALLKDLKSSTPNARLASKASTIRVCDSSCGCSLFDLRTTAYSARDLTDLGRPSANSCRPTGPSFLTSRPIIVAVFLSFLHSNKRLVASPTMAATNVAIIPTISLGGVNGCGQVLKVCKPW